MNDQLDAYKAKFGDKDYYVKLALVNSESDSLILNKSAVKYLEIVDSIFNPFHDGMMIVSNDYNFIERGATPFTFLGNGRDLLFLDIRPESTTSDFILSFQFVVIECTEVKFQNALCKKLKFVEYGQYLLNERACNIFNIKQNNLGSDSFLLTNTGQAMNTGDLIIKILNDVFDNKGGEYDLFTLDNGTGKPSFDADGSLSVSISPYASTNYGQLLDYVLKMHTHQGSPCILGHDRTQHKFQLISLKRLFANHEKYTNECFTFPDPHSTGNAEYPTDQQLTSPNISWKHTPVDFINNSNILEFYTEAPAAKHSVDHFANQSVSSYSRSDASFLYNLQTLNTSNIAQDFINLFVEPFTELFGTDYNLNVNYYNIMGREQWTDSTGVLPTAVTEAQFKNLKLMSLLYMNYNYIFKLPGNTWRQSMSFVDVTKRSLQPGEQPSQWDRNTIGRHFITCVKHIFTQDQYVNQVETIKPYRLQNTTTSERFGTPNIQSSQDLLSPNSSSSAPQSNQPPITTVA